MTRPKFRVAVFFFFLGCSLTLVTCLAVFWIVKPDIARLSPDAQNDFLDWFGPHGLVFGFLMPVLFLCTLLSGIWLVLVKVFVRLKQLF